MLNKNSMLAGVVLGLIFPAIAWLTEYLLKNNTYIINRPALPYFISIGLNLIMLRFSYKYGADKTARGIMLITFVCMLVIFVFKIHPIK
jgi:hypothetical protein